jgi:Heterokaryon incompatibility protein (HET)
MATTTTYPYAPLQTSEIRLLKILATPELRFEVIHHNLDRNIDYAALSYRWGENPVFNRVIHLGDYEFRVTDNLHDALASLKNRQLQNDAQTKSQYIWIDQICIDQNDMQERSSQVPLMRRIYEQATKVIVWLGIPDNPTQIALGFKKMEEFVNRHRVIGFKMLPSLLWNRPNLAEAEKQRSEQFMSTISVTDPSIFDVEGSPTHNAWLGICDMLQNPWWSRTWIYQEATILQPFVISANSTKVTFLYGALSTTWIHISIALRITTYLAPTQQPQTKFLEVSFGDCLRVYEMRILRLSSTPTFLDLLQMFRHSQCQNPRDKVYAPLCLAPNHIKEKVSPDYTKPLSEVYLDVVRVCLSEPGHELDFLGHAMKMKQPIRKPSPEVDWLNWSSWIPNWHQPLPLYPIPKVLHLPGGKPVQRNGIVNLNTRQVNVYNASQGSRAEAYIIDNRLVIHGVRCDIIKDLIQLNSNTGTTEERAEIARAEKESVWAEAADISTPPAKNGSML